MVAYDKSIFKMSRREQFMNTKLSKLEKKKCFFPRGKLIVQTIKGDLLKNIVWFNV